LLPRQTLDANSTDGEWYGIHFKYLGEVKKPSAETKPLVNKSEWQALDLKLKKKDGNSKAGAWTYSTLSLINKNSGMPSAELARRLKREQMELKRDVRKLKALGLTISLEAGYKLSERGESFLQLLSALMDRIELRRKQQFNPS
jgi:hypothetical protein